MKKALLMLPISLIVISTASCSWLFAKRDYSYPVNADYPSNIINRRIDSEEHYISYKDYTLKGSTVNKVFNKAEDVEYSFIEGTPKLNDKSFLLSVHLPSLWGIYHEEITFYENGYAQTHEYDSKAKEYYTYYFEFDKDVAKSLYTYVDDAYEAEQERIRKEQEERDNTEREYNAMVESMDMYSIFALMEQKEVLDIEFCFVTEEEEPRYYDFKFKDDGTILAALKAATYGLEASQSGYTPATIFIKDYDWSFRLDKSIQVAEANYQTYDKYGRKYSKQILNTVDMASINIIMNRAYELSAPKNPFGDNSSSAPSTSSEE